MRPCTRCKGLLSTKWKQTLTAAFFLHPIWNVFLIRGQSWAHLCVFRVCGNWTCLCANCRFHWIRPANWSSSCGLIEGQSTLVEKRSRITCYRSTVIACTDLNRRPSLSSSTFDFFSVFESNFERGGFAPDITSLGQSKTGMSREFDVESEVSPKSSVNRGLMVRSEGPLCVITSYFRLGAELSAIIEPDRAFDET